MTLAGLLGVVVVLVVIGVLLWALTAFVPMEPRIRQVTVGFVVVVTVIFLLFWLLAALGLTPSMHERLL